MVEIKLPVLSYPVSEVVKSLIDETVHEVVAHGRETEAIDGFGCCADYAIIGARVLTKLFGHSYTAVAGGEIVDCGGDEYVVIFPGRRARRTTTHLSGLIQYHCWIRSEGPVTNSLGAKVVDFTVRHNAVSALAFGKLFRRTEDKPYFWGDDEAYVRLIPDKVKQHPAISGRRLGWLWEDPGCTRLLKNYEQENQAAYDEKVQTILQRLTGRLESIAAEGEAAAVTPALMEDPSVPLTLDQFPRSPIARAIHELPMFAPVPTPWYRL